MKKTVESAVGEPPSICPAYSLTAALLVVFNGLIKLILYLFISW